MKTLKTYRIICFDANDVPDVLFTGMSRTTARIKLSELRILAEGTFLRYVMYRDKAEKPYDPRAGDCLWTGNLAR